MSTLGVTKVHVGVIMSTPGDVQYTGGKPSVHRGCSVYWGVFSTPGGYHEYMGDFGTDKKKPLPNLGDFCSCTFCNYADVYVGLWNIRQLVKILCQVARAQALTHSLFHF